MIGETDHRLTHLCELLRSELKTHDLLCETGGSINTWPSLRHANTGALPRAVPFVRAACQAVFVRSMAWITRVSFRAVAIRATGRPSRVFCLGVR